MSFHRKWLAVTVGLAFGASSALAAKPKKKPKTAPAPASQPAPAPAAEPAPAATPVASPPPAEDNAKIPDPFEHERPGYNPLDMPRVEASAPEPPTVRYTKATYPIEQVKRPLTLPENELEVGLDVPLVVGNGDPFLTQVLRAAYGVTVDFQLGLTYAIGLELPNAPEGTDGFTAGKAISLDSAYTIVPAYLAAQLRLGFLLDSDFGASFSVGAPFNVPLGDRWKLFGGNDLLQIRLARLPVTPEDPAANQAIIQGLARGEEAPRGNLALNFGALFQASAQTAVYGTMSVQWPDFTANKQPVALFLGTTWSASRAFDLGARAGFGRLDDANSLSFGVYAAFRL